MSYWRLEPTLRPPSYLWNNVVPVEVFTNKFSYRLFAAEDHWEAWTTWAEDPNNLASFDITVSFNSHAFSAYVIQLMCNLNSIPSREGSGCCLRQKHYAYDFGGYCLF